ncbi:MAG: VWA domain-containing protein [Candidatus Sericytochromatia bacterium]|nr:VWA domain-containing protein [Candidatus Tanganyikabacteria bacterium]
MHFAHPAILFGLALPALWLFLALRPERAGGLPLPTFRYLPGSADRSRRGRILLAMRAVALALLICALAGPRRPGEWIVDRRWGVDLMLALDLSGSMAAEDLAPNRYEAAKRVLADFVARVSDQRIGLVVFKARALTVSPLTTDAQVVSASVAGLDPDALAEDGTAIGDAVGTCLNRLAESKARHKIVVLLTDGENNSGQMSPLMAAAIARTRGVRIDTVAVGRSGGAPVPYVDAFGRKRYHQNRDGTVFMTRMDESTLARMAAWTGGNFFRATDTAALEATYARIARLTRSEVEQHRRRGVVDAAFLFLVPALLLLALELALALGPWRVLRARVGHA